MTETLIPAGIALTALVSVIGFLVKANASDRREYQDAVDKAEARADAMAARVADAWAAHDIERTTRNRAEDALAALRREHGT